MKSQKNDLPVFYRFIRKKKYEKNSSLYCTSSIYNDVLVEIEKPYKLISFFRLL